MKINNIFKKMNKKKSLNLKFNFEKISNINDFIKIQEKKLFLYKFNFSRDYFD